MSGGSIDIWIFAWKTLCINNIFIWQVQSAGVVCLVDLGLEGTACINKFFILQAQTARVNSGLGLSQAGEERGKEGGRWRRSSKGITLKQNRIWSQIGLDPSHVQTKISTWPIRKYFRRLTILVGISQY